MASITPDLIISGIFTVVVGIAGWNIRSNIKSVKDDVAAIKESVVSEKICGERMDHVCRKMEGGKDDRKNIWKKLNSHGHSCCADKGGKVMDLGG